MKYIINFYNGLMEDIKAFIFWMALLTFFRVIFLVTFASQLPEGAYGDVMTCLLLGTRLSLKTAGWICALIFLLTTIPASFWPNVLKWKYRLHSFAILLFCIMFMARFPYYRVFNDVFNGIIVTAFHEDWWAIISMLFLEYGIWWRLPVALILTDIFNFALKMFFWYAPLNNFANCQKKWIVIVASIIGLPLLCVFVRYGGAFSYRRGISWVSAARFSSPLLNATVLDDGQALNRVFKIIRLRQDIDNINLSEKEIRNAIKVLGGNDRAENIDGAFCRTVTQKRLAVQPRNVVIVLGESFGIWPFVEPFSNLHLVDNVTGLKESSQCAHIGTMLPGGSGTIASVQSVLTGLPSIGSRHNFMGYSEDFSAFYLTTIAKKLGYKTIFWYSGFAGWENIEQYSKNLGFDKFYHCGDFSYKGGNAWGAEDKEFFNAFLKTVKQQKNEKVLHVLLTGSNHPPYSVDVDGHGFPRQNIRKSLPPDIDDGKSTITEIGHMWYADKCIGEMVAELQSYFSDTLFVITGDHSERFSFAKEQSQYVRSAIPFLIYGQSVQPEWFSQDSVGCHQQVAATLAEILGDDGFSYNSIMPSMFGNDFVYNYNLCADKDGIRKIETLPKSQREKIQAAVRLSAQRILNGNEIKGEKK